MPESLGDCARLILLLVLIGLAQCGSAPLFEDRMGRHPHREHRHQSQQTGMGNQKRVLEPDRERPANYDCQIQKGSAESAVSHTRREAAECKACNQVNDVVLACRERG